MISVQEVEKLAELSRIKLTQDEKEQMAKEIGSILGYIDQIKEVSSSGEMRQAQEVKNIMREDVATNKPHEFTEAILNNAPARKENYFEVKKIIS